MAAKLTKVPQTGAPKGAMGQTYLASGDSLAMRLWQDEPADAPKDPISRDYETVGYAISGRAELHGDGEVISLAPGDSWVVPKGLPHTYKILESFTAVEATSPPAHAGGRDQP